MTHASPSRSLFASFLFFFFLVFVSRFLCVLYISISFLFRPSSRLIFRGAVSDVDG